MRQRKGTLCMRCYLRGEDESEDLNQLFSQEMITGMTTTCPGLPLGMNHRIYQ